MGKTARIFIIRLNKVEKQLIAIKTITSYIRVGNNKKSNSYARVLSEVFMHLSGHIKPISESLLLHITPMTKHKTIKKHKS
jgi:N-dimethylarginine dimethylaminohydrolase